MGKKVIKLKESDIVKIVKEVINEQPLQQPLTLRKPQNTALVKLIAFKCYKPGIVQITTGQCGTIDRGCYTFVYPQQKVEQLHEELKNETWEVDCVDLKKGIVYNKQGYVIKCPELAKYLLYKSNCCGNSGGGDCNGKPGCGGQNGGDDNPIGGCTTIRCKVESEIDKCTKKKYIWKEVKKAFEEEFPPEAPSGSSERNQQLWKEWKKGWRPKCKDGNNQGGGETGDRDHDQYAF